MPRYAELQDAGWLCTKYWGMFLGSGDIAKIIGCCTEAVRKALIRKGIKIRKRGEYQKYAPIDNRSSFPLLNDREWLIQKYDEEQLRMEDIADIVGCTAGNVRLALIRWGIKIGKSGGEYRTDEQKEKIRNTVKQTMSTKEYREKRRDIANKMWQENSKFIENWVKGMHIKPNNLEQLVDKILQQEYPSEWRYNGDYSAGVTLGGLIPDFVNVNGKKQVIEVFGDAFHDPEKAFINVRWKAQEFGRIATYAQLGYECIILWEHDLKDHAKEYIDQKLKQ